MTLKWFHIVFIAICMLMGIAIGIWAFVNNFLLLSVGSFVVSAGLCVYGSYFLQKARKAGIA